MSNNKPVILIVEDGDEYLENLIRFVKGPTYRQAKSGAAALEILSSESIDLLYLDMRFDRIPLSDLLGDHAVCTREQNGDPEKAWKYLQNNQGLYILAAMHDAGFGQMPVILSYDFHHELRRFEHLKQRYPRLRWVPDAVTPQQIHDLINELLN